MPKILVTRSQFIASMLRQRFSLPDSIIYYMAKNPQFSKVYQKLIQCCKYFFLKNPILVVYRLKIDDKGWKINFYEYRRGKKSFKSLRIGQKVLSNCKLWILQDIIIESSSASVASDSISKIFQCDAKAIEFYNQKLTVNEFLFYSRKVTSCMLFHTFISSESSSEFSIDKIIAILPSVTKFYYEFDSTSINVSKDTVAKLLQIPHFKQIKMLQLTELSEKFDIDAYYDYYLRMRRQNVFVLSFQNVSPEYEKKLDGILEDCLWLTYLTCPAPLLVYPTLDTTNQRALEYSSMAAVGPSLLRMTSAIFSVVYVTVPNAEIANKIAISVVESKLAACVNIVPGVKSIYEWEGKIQEDNELLLIVKTKTSELNRLKEHVLRIHPYEVPEFISLAIESGSDPYLKWINQQVSKEESSSSEDTAS